jgi:hypothetical protein
VQLGERLCQTPEQCKAWSQNLGHFRVMTTLTSYGAVASHRQAELIRGLAESRPAAPIDPAYLAQVMAARHKIAGAPNG